MILTETGRDTDVWLVDKPQGWSSHQVVNWVRRQTGEKRVGHSGTLDPLATGLLIILVGRQATKRQSEFLKLDKWYDYEAQLGLTSDTYDCTGELQVIATQSELQSITQQQVEQVIQQFTGNLTQVVPAFSAVKRRGKKLYELTRSGNLDMSLLPSRDITVFQHELLSMQWQEDRADSLGTRKLVIRGRVHVSSGTYIRSLIHDMGQALGVGAVMVGLRRTAVGEYRVDYADRIPELLE